MQLREVPFVPDVLYEKKMTERNLFAEMTEGFDALAAARKGKKTLRTTEMELKPVVEISAEELRAIREKLNLSRPVFAGYLRTNPRTLENWEQGRAKPNAQAALLIHLVSRYPDTVGRLSAV